jgi:hypothetical protein
MAIKLLKRSPGLRRLAKRVLIAGVSVVITLAAIELGLRVSGFTFLNPYVADPDVGFSLRPRAEGWSRHEGVVYIKINSAGLRDREHSIEKPPGTLRIAVLGDSFTEAFDVEMQDAWWAVMERELQNCKALAGRKPEVINFGVAGFSTARELIMLRRRVWQYAPDIVVLNLTTINDIKDNSLILNAQYAGEPIPYFVYKDGRLVLEQAMMLERNQSLYFRLQQSVLGQSLNSLRYHLRLMQLVDKARTAYVQRRAQGNLVDIAKELRGWEPKVYVEPTDPAWIDAWRVTEALILSMRDEVKGGGAQFLLVTGTGGMQVHPDPDVRREFIRSLGLKDLFYPDVRIKGLGDREGFSVLNLGAPMQDFAVQHKVFLHGQGEFLGTGHWNKDGHLIAGQLTGKRVCSEIVDQQRTTSSSP